MLENGKYGIIKRVTFQQLETLETTYNFEVEDYHTYYVGNDGILTHNTGDCGGGALDNLKIDEFTIKSKHLNSTGSGWGKFNVSTEAEAKLIVKDALKNGKLFDIGNNRGKIGTLGQKSFHALIEVEKVIGTKGERIIKICYDEFNNVWTIYPVKK